MWTALTLIAFADVYQYPSQGAESLGRGGAWVARATEPIALTRNPAGLAGQRAAFAIGGDVAIRNACFSRVKAANDPTIDAAPYPTVCDDGAVLPVGFGAMAIPVSARFALGAGLVTPSGVPRHAFPTFEGGAPSPQRYLLLDSTTAVVIPTLGAAYALTRDLRLGASLGWGVAWVQTSAAAPQVIRGAARPADVDVKVDVRAFDAFVPRATLGALWSPGPDVELGASATWSDAIDATGRVKTEANAFTPRAAGGDTSRVYRGTTDDAAHLTVPLPASATVGVRYRIRGHERATFARGDPLAEEGGDLELDATWSGNSAVDAIRLRFPPGIRVVGTPGSLAPNADAERRYRDTVSFHAGGDYALIPNQLGIRAGAFLAPHAAQPGFSGLEAMAGQRIGLSAGATLRVGPVDLSLAYLHMFVADLTGQTGVSAPAGQAPFRTPWSVASGTLEDGLDVLHVGAAYRFPAAPAR